MEYLNLIKSWDKDLFLYLNGIHSPLWDYVMTLFTLTPTWLMFYGLIFWIILKKYDKKALLVFIAIALLILLSDQFAGLLKHSIQRLRPSNDPAISSLTHAFFSKGGEFGFVSAHAANTFAFATFSLLLFGNSKYSTFIIFWATLIAYSRVYLGVHYPGDILGGAILGILCGISIYKLLLYIEARINPVNLFIRNRLKDKDSNRIIVTGLFIMIMSVGIITLLLQNNLIPIK